MLWHWYRSQRSQKLIDLFCFEYGLSETVARVRTKSSLQENGIIYGVNRNKFSMKIMHFDWERKKRSRWVSEQVNSMTGTWCKFSNNHQQTIIILLIYKFHIETETKAAAASASAVINNMICFCFVCVCATHITCDLIYIGYRIQLQFCLELFVIDINIASGNKNDHTN